MINVLIEMERLRNPYSGLGQYCLQLGRALTGMAAASGVQLGVYLPARQTGILGNDTTYFPVHAWHRYTGVPQRPNLWHCTHQDSAYFPMNAQTAVAMTIHDLNYLERSDYPSWKKQLKTNRLQRKINRCRGLVYISSYVQSWVRDTLNVPDQMVEAVIHNGMPEDVPATGTHASTPSFLFSIGMHPKKNYTVALPILLDHPNLHWVFAGPDVKGYQRQLEQAAQQLGVAGRLTFKGAVSEQEKWQLYSSCIALVMPSLSEGFGLPVLEAMAMGKPVFLSNRTSLPEIGGPEAYYFDQLDAVAIRQSFNLGLADFQNDPQKSMRMKAWAGQFSWKKAAAAYLHFYHQILETPHHQQ